MLKWNKIGIFLLMLMVILNVGCGCAKTEAETETGVETFESVTYYTSMVSDELGYTLACSDPAASQMMKRLEITKDGGESWEMVEDLSNTIHNYPCDMCFCTENEGIVLTDYHAYREYVYFTEDGGKSWIGMYLGEDDDLYSDGVSVTYDAEQDIVTIHSSAKVSEDDVFEEREYDSKDHGRTWEKREL
ncbi:MAG: hypothetical protein IJ567_01430 [Lachnospiraceae bacterium]|nr:hypothetical protein [Lachnospiraceae bacterium]